MADQICRLKEQHFALGQCDGKPCVATVKTVFESTDAGIRGKDGDALKCAIVRPMCACVDI